MEDILICCCLTQLSVLWRGEYLHTDQIPKILKPLYSRYHHPLLHLLLSSSPFPGIPRKTVCWTLWHLEFLDQELRGFYVCLISGCSFSLSQSCQLPQELPPMYHLHGWLNTALFFFRISLLFKWQLLDDTYHGSQITKLQNSKQNHLRCSGRSGSAALIVALDDLEGLIQPNTVL